MIRSAIFTAQLCNACFDTGYSVHYYQENWKCNPPVSFVHSLSCSLSAASFPSRPPHVANSSHNNMYWINTDDRQHRSRQDHDFNYVNSSSRVVLTPCRVIASPFPQEGHSFHNRVHKDLHLLLHRASLIIVQFQLSNLSTTNDVPSPSLNLAPFNSYYSTISTFSVSSPVQHRIMINRRREWETIGLI